MIAVMENPEQERGPIGEAAVAWIRENPDAMQLIERFAVEAASRRKRIGIRLILERVRWETLVATRGSKFKINNNHAPYIARWLVARNQAVADAVQLRVLRTP